MYEYLNYHPKAKAILKNREEPEVDTIAHIAIRRKARFAFCGVRVTKLDHDRSKYEMCQSCQWEEAEGIYFWRYYNKYQ